MNKKIGVDNEKFPLYNIFAFNSYNTIINNHENNKNIEKLHTTIINSSIVNQEIVNDIALISIAIEFKIIYKIHKDNTLYILNEKNIDVISVKLPANLSEERLIAIKNKDIRAIIQVYDINSFLQTNNAIDISYFILAAFNSLEYEHILFIATFNNLKDNIYQLIEEENHLIQKTFFYDRDIVSATNNEEILFITDRVELYKYDNNSIMLMNSINYFDILLTVLNINISDKLFIGVRKNTLHLSIIYDGIIYNMETNIIYTENKNPMYNIKNNLMFYIDSINGETVIGCSELMSLQAENKDFKLEERFTIKTGNVTTFDINIDRDFIAYVLNNSELYIYDINNKYSENINLYMEEYLIKDLQFSKSEQLLFILIRNNNCDNIYRYNLKMKTIKKVTENHENTEISSFKVNDINTYIYLSDNSSGYFNIYKASLYDSNLKKLLTLDAMNIRFI